MAKIGKRSARRQITKDNRSDSSDDDDRKKKNNSDPEKDDGGNEVEFKEIPVSQRQISKPVSVSARFNKRSSEEGPSVNPFKGLASLVKPPFNVTQHTGQQQSSFQSTLQSQPQNTLKSHSQLHTPPLVQSQTQTTQSQNTQTDLKEKEALANIKVLNESFRLSISEAIELDKYIDLTDLFEQYKKHRRSLEDDYEYARRNRLQPLALGFKPTISVEPLSPPMSLSVQSTAGSVRPAASPVKQATSQPMSLPATQPVALLVTQPIASPGKQPIVKEPETKPFSFGPDKIESSKPLSSGFSFPSLPSLPAFGTNGQSDKPLFSFGQSEQPDKPVFSFGENKSSGNSFSFGQTGQQPSGQKPFSFGEQSDKPAFSFGQSDSKFGQISKSNQKAEASDEDDKIPEGEEDSFGSQRTNQELIKRGEGEEQEVEVFGPLRTKLFQFDPNASAWTDLGICLIKVNKSAEGKHRVLCRAEGSGRILLNAYLEKGVCECSWDTGTEGRRREVSLQCFNQDRKMAKYLIRTKEEVHSRALFECLKELL